MSIAYSIAIMIGECNNTESHLFFIVQACRNRSG